MVGQMNLNVLDVQVSSFVFDISPINDPSLPKHGEIIMELSWQVQIIVEVSWQENLHGAFE